MTPILQVSSQEPSTSSKSHLLLSQPNHVESSSNFQNISHIIYWHDLWCKRWPQSSKSPVRNHQHPPSPTFSFLSQIMLDLHQTFRISPISSTNMIYDVKDDPNPLSLQSGTINILQVPSSPFSAKSCRIIIKLSEYLPYHLPTWSMMEIMTPILQVSSQEPSTSSKSHHPLSQPNHVGSW